MVGGAGAAGALTMFMAACGDEDEDKDTAKTSEDKQAGGAGGELEIVNCALTLEYLEAAFYADIRS